MPSPPTVSISECRRRLCECYASSAGLCRVLGAWLVECDADKIFIKSRRGLDFTPIPACLRCQISLTHPHTECVPPLQSGFAENRHDYPSWPGLCVADPSWPRFHPGIQLGRVSGDALARPHRRRVRRRVTSCLISAQDDASRQAVPAANGAENPGSELRCALE